MDEFELNDPVVVIKGEFDGRTGLVTNKLKVVELVEVTLDGIGHEILLDPSAISKQQ